MGPKDNEASRLERMMRKADRRMRRGGVHHSDHDPADAASFNSDNVPSTGHNSDVRHEHASPAALSDSNEPVRILPPKSRKPVSHRHRGRASADDRPKRSPSPSQEIPTTGTAAERYLWLVNLAVGPMWIAWWLARTIWRYSPPIWAVGLLLALVLVIGVTVTFLDWVSVAPGLGAVVSGAASLTRFLTGWGSRSDNVEAWVSDTVKWPKNAELAVYKQSGDMYGSLQYLERSAGGLAGEVMQQCLEGHMRLKERETRPDAGVDDAATPNSLSIKTYLDDTRSTIRHMSAADQRFVDDVARVLRHGYRDALIVKRQLMLTISERATLPGKGLLITTFWVPVKHLLPSSTVGMWLRGELGYKREAAHQGDRLGRSISYVADNLPILLRMFDSGDDLGSSVMLQDRMAGLYDVLQEAVHVGQHMLAAGKRDQAAKARTDISVAQGARGLEALGDATWALQTYQAIGLTLKIKAKKAAADYQTQYSMMLDFQTELGRTSADLQGIMEELDKATQMTHVTEANKGLFHIADAFVGSIEKTFFPE
ncbi:uncharacterized protein LY79DRAFT_674533 [Colletotrichum navitas]|uniref:Uncharacterized protein n=1 Tax=Colletotrichum navitas TaxID=681940 RepID=A0AAD8PLA3_9PEZI|nr:uncharacterized protein LY79DRAFT_674533 [Colletotrichum navitas]KAK1569646.1 hypothetical protein LY79DRAFT_674533 [Colletotrichum navitas]